MPISENQLATWGKQGPTAQFTATYETLKNRLSDNRAPYCSKQFSVFLQGSYKNDTNVYGDSDVDVVMRLDQTFYEDLSYASEEDARRFRAARSDATYTLEQFKRDVTSWLVDQYGSDVQPGKKAIYVKGSGSRRNADILVCCKHRRYAYFRAWGDESYTEGVSFHTASGDRIDNFPQQHHDNCTKKHQVTGSWFKHTVRTYKIPCQQLGQKIKIVHRLSEQSFNSAARRKKWVSTACDLSAPFAWQMPTSRRCAILEIQKISQQAPRAI